MSHEPSLLREVRAALSIKAPFFGTVMYRLTDVRMVPASVFPAPMPSACTDGKRVWLCQEFFEQDLASPSERVFVLAHELWHVMAGHPSRMKYYAVAGLCGEPFQPGLYNWAADAVINRSLIDSSIGIAPKSAVLHDEVSADESVEAVYERFLKKQQGQPGGFGGEPFDTLLEGGDDAPSEQERRMAVAQGVAAQKLAGAMPAGLKAFIEAELDPQVPWEDELREFFITTAGNNRTNWSRPNRRRLVLPGIYTPKRMGSRCGPIVLGFDTSGSMSDAEIRTILGVAADLLSSVRPDSLHVVWCDAVVERVDEVQDPSELLEIAIVEGVPGRGGTWFDPVFDWVSENLEEPPAALIYGTDMMPNGWPGEGYEYPVIWLATTDHPAPWGHTIRVHL